MSRVFAIVLALCIIGAHADIYMHSPKGANNRLDEANRDRNNGNRMFDSQNNDRGGSNVGATNGEKYYAGSVLPIEWTNQHSCGSGTGGHAGEPNNDCNVVVQYMCDNRVRDGTSTNTIPTNNADCANNNCDTDQKYGRHESTQFYNTCEMTQRNLNLWTSNQNVNGRVDQDGGGPGTDSPNGIKNAGSVATRQNPNGARRGLECPEERDYYPYWGASPFVDIAILTNTPERCEAYTKASANVTPRAACIPPNNVVAAKTGTKGWIPADKAACEANGYKWSENAQPANGKPAPLCIQNFNNRDNQLGNTDNSNGDQAGFPNMVNWTIPAVATGETCVVRIRYNISSAENGSDKKDITDLTIGAYGFQSLSSIEPSLDKTQNQNAPGNGQNNNKPAKIDVWSQFNLPPAAIAPGNRDFAMRNNPQVQVFSPQDVTANTPRFQLAINTNQFFRTFQDRSHTLKLGVPRAGQGQGVEAQAAQDSNAPIFNVNVHGKRGNVVQTFPGTEYDFNPNFLTIRANDYIHFMWTGSNTNPANNDGNGNNSQDRSNLVALRPAAYAENGVKDNKASTQTQGQLGRSYPTTNINKNNLFGWDQQTLDDLATKGIKNSFFDAGPQQVPASAVGVWNFMGTRNNNFTNRSQKARIHVSASYLSTAKMNYSGGHVFSGANYLRVHAGTLAKTHKVIFTGGPTNDEWESDWINVEVYAEGQTVPHEFHQRDGMENTIDLMMSYKPSPFTKPQMYRTIDGETELVQATFNHQSGTAMAKVNHGGMHVIKSHINVPLVIGLSASTLFILGAVIAGSVAAFRKQAKAL